MASLLTLTYSSPTLSLAKGEVLVKQGAKGGDLFVLESGELVVERDGREIALINASDSVVGEMSVLLGKPYSATVRATSASRVRVVRDAIRILEGQPGLALRLATILGQRLDATSGLLVQMGNEQSHPVESEMSALRRLFGVLFGQRPDREPG